MNSDQWWTGYCTMIIGSFILFLKSTLQEKSYLSYFTNKNLKIERTGEVSLVSQFPSIRARTGTGICLVSPPWSNVPWVLWMGSAIWMGIIKQWKGTQSWSMSCFNREHEKQYQHNGYLASCGIHLSVRHPLEICSHPSVLLSWPISSWPLVFCYIPCQSLDCVPGL